MANEELALYRLWLKSGLESNKNEDRSFVQQSFADTIMNSPAYQSGALVNGESHPLAANRTETKKCSVTIMPEDNLYIGDLVEVFGEHWICMELYIDEYGMKYGELWLCNQIFTYQDHNLNIIKKYAILDDGSYSGNTDKILRVSDNSYTCYISLDEETKALYIDKRLAISKIYNAAGVEILEVGKIQWIDVKSRNFGEGSHLMLFGVNEDAYSKEADSIENMICDYQEVEISDEPIESPVEEEYSGYLAINGRTSLRIGSGRTYTVNAILLESGESITPPHGVKWSVESENSQITIVPNGASCRVFVSETDDLIGLSFTLVCECLENKFSAAKQIVEVV